MFACHKHAEVRRDPRSPRPEPLSLSLWPCLGPVLPALCPCAYTALCLPAPCSRPHRREFCPRAGAERCPTAGAKRPLRQRAGGRMPPQSGGLNAASHRAGVDPRLRAGTLRRPTAAARPTEPLRWELLRESAGARKWGVFGQQLHRALVRAEAALCGCIILNVMRNQTLIYCCPQAQHHGGAGISYSR